MFGWRKPKRSGVILDSRNAQVNTGVVHGDMIQITDGRRIPRTKLSIPWTTIPQDTIPGLLTWKSRIPKTLHGRDEEMAQLLAWAEQPQVKSLFLLHGPGGVGKTRLAFEFAERLRNRGWHAGELPNLEAELALDLGGAYGEAGVLLVLDYPEEKRQTAHDFLALVTRLSEEQGGRLRILLLGRNASVLQGLEGDAQYLHADERELKPLRETDAGRYASALFQDAWIRIRQIRDRNAAPGPNLQAFQAWLGRDRQHHNPLFILAYALNLSDHPEAAGLDAGALIKALVNREVRRLEKEARDLGMPETGYVLLKALAALTDGLDARHLARLRATAPSHPPLPELDVLYRSREASDRRIHPLRPDLLAAELLDHALGLCEPETGGWLYRTLALVEEKQALIDAAGRLGRLRYDWTTMLRSDDQPRTDPWLEALEEYAVQDLGRCHILGLALDRDYLERSLLPLSLAITQTRADAIDGETKSEQTELARHLNTLSVRLAENGDHSAALVASQRAVDIRESLAQDNFTTYGPELASSLGNLSIHLAQNGDRTAALVASQQATGIHESLARDNLATYGPNLAQSLNNLSVRLAESGDRLAALVTSQRAVDIRESLAQDNFTAYGPVLAQSLNNLSVDLAESGDHPAALVASQRAVDIRESLARDNFAAYGPELAASLNNLSNHLAKSGDRPATLVTNLRAVDIYESLAHDNFTAYGPVLAGSLGNLSNRLAEGGDRQGALTAMRRAVEIIEPFAKPGTLYADWQVSMQNKLHRLEEE